MSLAGSNELPRGWAETTLEAILQPRVYKEDPQAMPQAKFIGMENIEAQTMRLLGVVEAGSMKSKANAFESGDVLYGRLRPYLNKVYSPDFGGLCSGEFIVIRVSFGIHARFLGYRLNSSDFVRFASRLNTGDRPRVDFDQIKAFSIQLPPVEEQTRIAEMLDELLTDLDAGVRALERARERLNGYRTSLLKAAVEGTLTVCWRAANSTVEPASELLKRILAERRVRWEDGQHRKFVERGTVPPKNWRTKYKEPAEPDTEDLPPLPKGWCWTSLGRCFVVRVGATPRRSEAEYWNGDIPWVASGEVQFGPILATRESITSAGLANSSTRINPKGSVILNMIGEGKTRGKAGILEIDACNNQNCAAIWVSQSPILPKYVYYWLVYQYEETRKLGSGNNQPAMNKSIVERIVLPLPPIAEQEAIVEILDGKLSLIDYLEANLGAKLKAAHGLRQSILGNAFSGTLVPQDPNDEPASELLMRLAKDRQARVQEAPIRKRPGRKKKGGGSGGRRHSPKTSC